jgi:hypothetical protein
MVHLPGPESKVEAVWDEAYYRAAKAVIAGVAQGEYLPALEGVPGLYLFRHYIELALKYVIFHSRWLRDAHTIARDDDIEDVKKTHSLGRLWTIVVAECKRVIPDDEWNAIDVEFVERCVQEFDAIDPDGERFRYHGPKFGIQKAPVKREETAPALPLYVDFVAVASDVDHVHDVLRYLDVYMVETHGEVEEWQDYLRSL